jgi:5'-phosphate synthase pdxT subunit
MDNSAENTGILVGLLAFQGDYTAHRNILHRLDAETIEVRTGNELEKITHLVIPGGESTTFLKLLEFHNLTDLLRKHVLYGKPVMVTCAGLILLAKDVRYPHQESLGILDISVERNAYGRQVDSFTANLELSFLNDKNFNGVFIRAPRISRTGEDVDVLASLDGDPVMIRQGNILGLTFHPELTDDVRIHEMFVGMG